MVYGDYDLCENCETKIQPTVRNTLKVIPPPPADSSSANYVQNVKPDEMLIAEEENKTKHIHHGYGCNGCRMRPIVGTRYFERKRSDQTIISF